jgi:hypothetical protein
MYDARKSKAPCFEEKYVTDYKMSEKALSIEGKTNVIYKSGTKVERRKIEKMYQFRLSYIYSWKCH